MKAKVEQTNKEILEKEERLLKKADDFFSSIDIPTSVIKNTVVKQNVATPPISFILYGIAGIVTVCGIVTDSQSIVSKLLCFGVAGISAYGGYKIAANKASAKCTATSNTTTNTTSLKNDVATKVTEYIKGLINDWETFMSTKQSDIQNFIEMNVTEPEEKDTKISKIYTYEVFDISISDFVFKANALPNDSNLNSSLKILLDEYKKKVDDAIKITIKKQIERYNSLV